MRVWQKLALVLLIIGVLPLVFATVLVARQNAEHLTRSARSYRLAASEVALTEARSMVARALAETRALGDILRQTDQPRDVREMAARSQLLGAELIDQLALYSSSGERVLVMHTLDENQRWDSPLTLEEAWRDQALTQNYFLFEALKRADGQLVLPMLAPIFAQALPTSDEAEAKVYAYALVTLSLHPLTQLSSDLNVRHFEGNGKVRFIDERGFVLASSQASEEGSTILKSPALSSVLNTGETQLGLRRNLAMTTDYTDADGEGWLGALVPLPEFGWGVMVEQAQAEAYIIVRSAYETALWVGVGASLLALFLALFMGRRMAKPVENIARASRQVAAGDFSVRVPVTTDDEVGETGLAFNAMSEALATYRDSLISATRARENLSRFLSPEVVERVVQDQDALKLGGERREVTILFADVVGFTSFAEECEPEVAVAVLNELFTFITEIVFQHGGIIDKFIGDCVMAMWGAPDSHPDDAQRAVRAAEAMLRWLEVGNARWRKQIGRDIQMAIGVHTGVAVVGNVGSEKRMEYTAIGDTVNIAARLERLARPGQILMTRETAHRVSGEFEAESLGSHMLAGKSRPTELFILQQD